MLVLKSSNREIAEENIRNYHSELSTFFDEIKENKIEVVRQKLLLKQFHVDCYDQNYTTPLFIATKNGHLNMVKMLINEFGSKISDGNLLGITPMLVACSTGNIEIIKVLLKSAEQSGTLQECLKYSGMCITPMGMACAHGQLEVVKLLLHCKQPLQSLKNTISPSPLMLAVMNNHQNIIRFFFLPNILNNTTIFLTLNEEEKEKLQPTLEEATFTKNKLNELNVNVDIDEIVPEFFNLNLLGVAIIAKNSEMIQYLYALSAKSNFPKGSTISEIIKKYVNSREINYEIDNNSTLNSSTVSNNSSNSISIKKKSSKLKKIRQLFSRFAK